MKHFVIIIVILFSLFSVTGQVSAETPPLLDKDLKHQGVTSPLPAFTAEKKQTNYYPDHRLPELQTRFLILLGISLIFCGSIVLVPAQLTSLFHQTRKRPTIVMPNVVLR